MLNYMLGVVTFTGGGIGIAGSSQVAKCGPAAVGSSHIAGGRPTAFGTTIAAVGIVRLDCNVTSAS